MLLFALKSLNRGLTAYAHARDIYRYLTSRARIKTFASAGLNLL